LASKFSKDVVVSLTAHSSFFQMVFPSRPTNIALAAIELKEAWRKKPVEVTKGRKFKISSVVVHDNETDIGGWPTKSRSVSGTITLID